MSKDICVIGAGVVGLALAKEMAKRGMEVEVCDMKRKISDNADKASGILSKKGLDSTGINYNTAIVNALDGAVIHSKNEELRIKAKETKAFILDRAALSEICKKEAEAEGVKISLGRKIDKKEIKELQKEYKVIVGADGAVSTVANAFNFPNISDYILTYKAKCTVKQVKDKNVVDLYFDNNITNRFFGWVAPHSDSIIEIGVGVDSKFKKNSKNTFDKFIENPDISNIIGENEIINGQGSLIPINTREKTVIKNVLLVGDAAGQVKATTGGGIIFGIKCAKTAADAIWENITYGKDLRIYETEWRRKFGADLYIHKLIHNYYSLLGNNQMDMLLKTIKVLKGEKFFSKYGDMDSPKEMIKKFFFRNLVKNQ
ncbi:NAD(P)/FAD-dependent oxidoreductase [Candidatus Marsarchaeota archaeon]|nr:NAD(P)/FAD-dependent oxidoreductase [Candidatus Marsarchaeota archaeon]